MMKLTSWNILGINSPSKCRMIKNCIRPDKPSIFFMQETKCISSTFHSILSRLWLGYNTIDVNEIGASRGLEIA